MNGDICFLVINCDGQKELYEYNTIDDLKREWYREDAMPDIPMLDDTLLFAKIGDVHFCGGAVIDAMKIIGKVFEWKF